MYNVLLVDDHEIIIDGIKALLAKEKNITIIGAAMNGNEAIAKTKELKPDVILMDISMPEMNGIEATKTIKSAFPQTKILMLTQHESKEYVLQVLKAGADGYLLKNSRKEELIKGIDAVCSGKKYLGDRISDMMLNNMFSPKEENDNEFDPNTVLTRREIEIIKLLATDFSNKEVADKLEISIRTVETHRRNVMQKLNLKSSIALVRFAVKYNYIEL